MKSFFIKLTVFLVIIFVVDHLSGRVMGYIYNNTTKGDYGRSNYICKQTNQDILIFGSSRAIHHYDPTILKEKLGMTCYNCGEDGMGIICSYGRYSMIKQRYNPKLIIYDIEVAYDVLKDDNTRYLGFLRPYYEEPGIDSIFYRVSPNERYKMMSHLYRYNSRWLDIVAQYRSKSNLFAKDYTYSPLKATLNYEPERYRFPEDSDCDSLKLYYLERFIKDCESNGTKVIFTISPVYGETYNKLLKSFHNICVKYQIPILDHFADKIFSLNRDLFKDKKHLNDRGAKLYSEMIAEEIANTIANDLTITHE